MWAAGFERVRPLDGRSRTFLGSGRGYLTEHAAELERRSKRQCTEFDIPLALDGGPDGASPAAHHPPGGGLHPHIAGAAAAVPTRPPPPPPWHRRRSGKPKP